MNCMAAKYGWAKVGPDEQHVSGNKGMELAVELQTTHCCADDAFFFAFASLS
jgi:hypothetical protein